MNGHPLTILFVEDNPDHAELVMRSFEDHRVANQIHHLTDGEAALDYLLRRGVYSDPKSSPRPHVVLLDLRLPKVDGLKVLEEIRGSEGLEKIPVVILTTSHAEMDVGKAYEHHANSYLVKPLDFDKFTKLMDDLGFYWLGWNHYPWPYDESSPQSGTGDDSGTGDKSSTGDKSGAGKKLAAGERE